MSAIQDGLIICAFAWLLAGTFIRALIAPIAPGFVPAPKWWIGLAEFVLSTLTWPRFVVAFVRGAVRSLRGRR